MGIQIGIRFRVGQRKRSSKEIHLADLVRATRFSDNEKCSKEKSTPNQRAKKASEKT